MAIKKGYAAAHAKLEEQAARQAGGTFAFPFIKLYDGNKDPDPAEPSEVLCRVMDAEPSCVNVFILEKGTVRFIGADPSEDAYEGTKALLDETFKPSFRGIYPVLVFSKDSDEVKAYLETFEDDDTREEMADRLFNNGVETDTVHRMEFAVKYLPMLEMRNKKKPLLKHDIVISRTGAGASDTSYSFEMGEKRELTAEQKLLELPDMEKLYAPSDPKEIQVYLTKGTEGLKAFKEKRKTERKAEYDAKKSDGPSKPAAKPAKGKGKKAVEVEDDDDEDEIEVNWK